MIYQQIKADIIKAMKEKNSFVLQTLRSLDSEIQNKALIPDSKLSNQQEIPAERKDFSDELVVSVLQKGIKQRQDSFDAYMKGNRPDLAQAEEAQMFAYKKYLPQMMTEDEIKVVVSKIIAETPNPNMGLIMKVVNPITKGKADGKLVSKIVQEALKK